MERGVTLEEKLLSSSQIIGVFLIKKLGKRKFSSKERLFIVTETSVSYYVIPKINQQNKYMIETLKKIYALGMLSRNIDDTDRIFYELGKEFEKLKSLFDLLKKSEFQFDAFETIIEVDNKDNPKSYKCPVIFRNKLSDYSKNPHIYSKIVKSNNQDKVGEKQEQWIIDFIDNIHFDRYKRIMEEIRKKKNNINIKEAVSPTKSKEGTKDVVKALKKEEEKKENSEKKKEEVTSPIENDPDMLSIIYYNELCYQYLFKQYYNVNLDDILKMKYEFSILQVMTKFREICQVLVKKIINDLSARVFQSNTNTSNFIFFPMMFPVPKSLKKTEQATFLYYILGINFQVTWVR
jgi:hypothetical protein